jgi:hypothetical protein
MKKIFYIAFISASVISCKEQIPVGLDLTAPITSLKDTTYIESVIPAAQAKHVVVEEFTGVACVNCPVAATQIKNLQLANPNKVLVAKVHSNFLATPIKGSDNDLRSPDAEALSVAMSMQNKPQCGVDRLQSATGYTWDMAFVDAKVNAQLAKPSTINIDLVKKLNATKDSVNIVASFTFLKEDTNKYNYHYYILENDLEATQDSLAGIELEGYVHEEVLRKSITPVFIGTEFPNANKEAGRKYVYVFDYAKPAKVVKYENCMLLCFVTNRYTREVIQAAEVKFK